MIKRFTKSAAAQFLRANAWAVIVALWGVGLGLGVWGFLRHAADTRQPITGLDALYLALQLIPMNSGAVTQPVNAALEIARLLVPFMAAITAVKAIASLFQEQVALAGMHLRRGHVVICGLGRTGFYLAQDYLKKGERLVAIELDAENPHLQACRALGAVVIVGNAADATLLMKAAVHRARLLAAVCGDDGVNAEIAILAHELLHNQPHGRLECRIHISDPHLRELMRVREIHAEADGRFELEIFNLFERGGWLISQQHPFIRPEHLQGGAVPRMIVVGVGRLGESLLVHAARQWWDHVHGQCEPMQIIVIDRFADQKVESLALRYPQLKSVCTIIPVQADIDGGEFQRGSYLYDGQQKLAVDAVYICVDDDTLSLRAALILDQLLASSSIPIVVRTVESKGLAHLLANGKARLDVFSNLHPFGLLPSTCTAEIIERGTHEILARAIHETYLRQQASLGKQAADNPALLPWERLPEHLKRDNRREAYRYAAVLRSHGYRIETLRDWNAAQLAFQPGEASRMAQQLHELWKRDREAEGWRHAPHKDLARKLSPDLVDWSELPAAEREKNEALIRDLPQNLYQANFQVRRADSYP